VLALPPLLAVLPAVALLALAGDRLPDPLAVHFALDGTADAFLPRWAATALNVALGLLLAAVLTGAGRAAQGPRRGRRARSGRSSRDRGALRACSAPSWWPRRP
jgi:hypothetical protein